MALHRWLRVLLAACWLASDSQAQTRERPFDLELRIDCPQQNIHCGDEIPIVCTITNKDPEPFSYDYRTYDRSGRMEEYELTAKRVDGALVPDPRGENMPTLGGGLGGGLRQLETGASFQTTVVLNLWARITEPGRYAVAGIYHCGVYEKGSSNGRSRYRDVRVKSSPIEITVKPRSPEQMGDYIRGLILEMASLAASTSPDAMRDREHLAARLAYTCDTRIVPTMVDLMYRGRKFSNESFEACQAFWCYLPHREEVRTAVLTAARSRGLCYGSVGVLEHLGCSEAELAEVIRLSLLSNDPNTIHAAVLAAQEHPADEHMRRLIAMATRSGDAIERESAIYGVANHRTDEGVAALKMLLNDSNARIRETTSHAVEWAYRRHPVYPENVDEAFTKLVSPIAANSGHIHQRNAILALARTRTPEGVRAVKILLADPNAAVALVQTDLGVRTIRDLLRDRDPDVREYTKNYVEAVYHEYRGRPLRPDDFPPEFQETPEQFKQKVLKGMLKDR